MLGVITKDALLYGIDLNGLVNCSDTSPEEFAFVVKNLVAIAVLLFIQYAYFPQYEFVAYCIFGLYMIYSNIAKALLQKQAIKWPVSPIQIQNVDIGTLQVSNEYGGRHTCYYPSIKYSYEVDGKIYTSDQTVLRLRDIVVTEQETAKKFAETLVSKELQAFYNPKNHSNAVLIPEYSKVTLQNYYALALGGVMVIMFGLGIQYVL